MIRDLTMTDPLGREVLHDLSFSVKQGEMVGLAGAMGSGRTALLSALFGASRGEVRGTVLLDGAPCSNDSPAHAIASGFALVPEDRKRDGVVLGLTLVENLALVPATRPRSLWERVGFIDHERDELDANTQIQDLHIRGAADATVATLSGGNQRNVALGKWLRSAPKLILLDEPTRGVDVGAREEIYGILDELRRKGTAILFASSDPAELERLAERVVVLHGGRLVATLERGEATQARIAELTTGATRARAPHTPSLDHEPPCNP